MIKEKQQLRNDVYSTFIICLSMFVYRLYVRQLFVKKIYVYLHVVLIMDQLYTTVPVINFYIVLPLIGGSVSVIFIHSINSV